MKVLLLTALGLGFVLLGKKFLGNRTIKPLAALPSSEREHSEEELIQISPAPIH